MARIGRLKQADTNDNGMVTGIDVRQRRATVWRWRLSVGLVLAVLAQAAIGAINVQMTQDDIRRATELARQF